MNEPVKENKPVKTSNVLGIHCAYSHDAGASVVIDGKLVSAVAEERLSRLKKDNRFPALAIASCLDLAGLAPQEIDLVAVAAEDISYMGLAAAQDYFAGRSGPFGGSGGQVTLGSLLQRRRWLREIEENRVRGVRPFIEPLRQALAQLGLRSDVELLFVDHHMAHMSSVFFTTGRESKDEAYIFVVDAYGDDKSVSVFKTEGADQLPEPLRQMAASVSPGNLYSRATAYLGMKPNRHEGKVTGLAGYGDPTRLFPPLENVLHYDRASHQFQIRCNQNNNPFMRLIRYVGLGLGLPVEINATQRYMKSLFDGESKEDIAAAVQARFDHEIVEFVKDTIGDSQPSAIMLTGGIFANVKTNAMIAAAYPLSELVVHPGMTDEGVAVGAALFGYHQKTGELVQEQLEHVYLGNKATDTEIEAFVAALDPEKYRITQMPEPETRVAQLIADGQAVGLFQGGMEYGPRALGNRTILADPRDKDINNWLNQMLNRTEYMPFAPVCHGKSASKLFDLSDKLRYTSRFMTVIAPVRQAWRDRMPGVVHVDGTARPQLIELDDNPVYYRVIEAFEAITGIPALINTSFNLHEEPIVARPAEALAALDRGGIHALFLVPFIIERRSHDVE